MWTSQARVLIHHVERVLSNIIIGIMFEPDFILDDIDKRAPIRYKLDLIFHDWEVLFGSICSCEGFECVWIKIALSDLVSHSSIVFDHHIVSLKGVVLLCHCRIRCEWNDIGTVLEWHYIACKIFCTTIAWIVDTNKLLSGIVLISISFIVISTSIAVVR